MESKTEAMHRTGEWIIPHPIRLWHFGSRRRTRSAFETVALDEGTVEVVLAAPVELPARAPLLPTQQGTAIAPELSLTGKIIERNLKITSSKQRIEYIFQLSLTDINTGLAFWEGEETIGKIGKR